MLSIKEVELAARLFHSSDVDELMECLGEHPAQNRAKRDERPSPVEAPTRRVETAAPASSNAQEPQNAPVNRS